MKGMSYVRLLSLTLVSIGLSGCNTNNSAGDGGASGGPGTAGAPLPTIVGARSLSAHYVEVQFTKPVGSEALDPGRYSISAAGGANLEVSDVITTEESDSVILATGTQDETEYSLGVTDSSRVVSTVDGSDGVAAQLASTVIFIGSSTTEPYLQTAISLDATTILLTFGERMDRLLAEDPSFYHIADPDADTDIDIVITDAQLGEDETTVLLTTSPQSNINYLVKVTNVKSRYTCDDGETVVLDADAQGSVCAVETFQPVNTDDKLSSVRMTARTRIDESAPTDPNATGDEGAVVVSLKGAGVQTVSCSGSTCISGAQQNADEELRFDFDVPVRADSVVLGLLEFDFRSDEPVVFVSSVSSPDFDITIEEPELMEAFVRRRKGGQGEGDIEFAGLVSLAPGLRIDAFKIRETQKDICGESLCIEDGRLVDPTRNQATFFGIPPVDESQPQVIAAASLSSTSVLVSFSEPLNNGSDDPLHFVIGQASCFGEPDCPGLIVSEAVQTQHQTQMLLTTSTQVPDRLYTVQVSDVRDKAGNLIDPAADSADFRGSSRELFVHSAIALDNTSVLVTFSEPMDPATTECTLVDGCNAVYQLFDPDGDTDVDIRVTEATVDPGERTVVLTTTSQENILYTLRVTNVRAIRDDFLLDPTRNIASFFGIPAIDKQGPTVVDAVPTSNKSVLVSFSEPLGGTGIQDPAPDGEPEDPTNYRITQASCTIGHCESGLEAGQACSSDGDCGGPCLTATSAGCPELIIETAELTVHDTQVLLTTLSQVVDLIYTVTANNLKDKSGNDMGDPNWADFFGIPPINDGAPRVVGAISTSNTSVTVTFTKDMGPSAIQPENYSIVQENVNSEAGALAVLDAQFLGGQTNAVELTTVSQSEITYRVTVVNVRDLAGNQLAPPELLVNPASVIFAGTPFGCPASKKCSNGYLGLDDAGACAGDNDCTDQPTCLLGTGLDCEDACELGTEPCDFPDADGDGLQDNEEQRGWIVRVTMIDGTIMAREVTSDPNLADTDGDGLDDRLEKLLSLDPRDVDTDDDELSDFDEFNRHFTEPTLQDTDGDGIDDFTELTFFKTSPVLADTDGDGFEDGQEVLAANRNVRVSDIPQPRIEIGDIALRLDTRFSFTDTQGVSRTSEESVTTSLERSEDTSFGFSDTSTTTHQLEAEVGVEKELGPTGSTTISGKLGYTFTQENSTTVSRESSQSTTEAYERSLSTSETIDETQEVTREVVGAQMQILLTVANIGDIAFTMTNLEVTALLQDPVRRGRLIPVATLIPSSQLITGEIPAITTGPLVPERGPFIFESRDIFPNLVEDLMKNPRGLIFKVANFDLIDEFGRNFAFVSQEIADRTVGLTIDFGNSRVDRFRVATYNSFEAEGNFDEFGRPRGIRMQDALQEILELEKNGPPDAITVGTNGCGETWASGDDIQFVNPICFAVLNPATKVIILPGPNGRLNSIPVGDDLVAIVDIGSCDNKPSVECSDHSDCGATGVCSGLVSTEVIIDGGDGCAQTSPLRDDAALVILADNGDEQIQQSGCAKGGPDGEIIVAGPDGILDTVPNARDLAATITGYGTTIFGVCDGRSLNAGESCLVDGECLDAMCLAGFCSSDLSACTTTGDCKGICKTTEKVTRVAGIEDETAFRCNGDSRPDVIGRKCSSDDECGGQCDALCDDDTPCNEDADCSGIGSEACKFLGCDMDSDCALVAGLGLCNFGPGACEEVRDRFWLVIATNPETAGVDFDQIRLRAGDVISIAYIQDADNDGLTAREEFLYGSSDIPPRGFNSDDCPFVGSTADEECIGLTFDRLGDFDEVRRGWEVSPVGVRSYFGFSDPTLPDSDLDRLFDCEEQTQGTDPRKRDTDDDGIRDFEEVNGYTFVDRDGEIAGQVPAYQFEVILDGGDGVCETPKTGSDVQVVVLDKLVDGRCNEPTDQDLNRNNIIAEPISGGNGKSDTLARSGTDDIQIVAFGSPVDAGDTIIEPGPNGIIDSVPGDALGNGIFDGGDDEFGSGVLCDEDGDCDGAAAGRCVSLPGGICIRPADGERTLQTLKAALLGDDFIGLFHERLFATDPLNRDTDGDTLLDGVEASLGFLGANPNDPSDAALFRDDDRDGLVNFVEREGWIPVYLDALNALVCRDGQGFEIPGPDEDCRVRSDTFEPDSDFDGLPDLFEFIFGTNPKDRDTDDDGLLDFDELDPESFDSVDIPTFRDFEDECFLLDRCEFDPADSLLYGTSLLAVDTDTDGRTDLEEVFESWTVNVQGQEAYVVFSSPTEADIDLDTRKDAQELTAGTDPNKGDTDGDGVPDNAEVGNGQNALIPDQRVRVQITSITIVGDCDPGESGGDFQGLIQVQKSGVIAQQMVNMDTCCDEDAGIEEGDTVSFPGVPRSFVIQEGDAIIVFSNAIEEEDDSSGDEQLGSFTRSFSFPISGSLQAIELMESDNSCMIRIILEVAWIR